MVPSTLPSARAISNAVAAQSRSIPNAASASDWLWQWGQFLDHDIDLTDNVSPPEPFMIPVPTGDAHFDPDGDGGKIIPLNRSLYDHTTGTGTDSPRQQINQITSFIDGSNVYGSDDERAADLRDAGGTLRTSNALNGEMLLPLNTSGLPNAGGPSDDLFIAGDIRANEQVGLTATHTLFVREHNRLAADIGARLSTEDPDLVALRESSGLSTDDFIYETSRVVVGAQVQAITYNEFLPLLLGPDAIAPYTGYDPTVNPSIANEFSTGAYRLGHSLLSPNLQLADDDGPLGEIALRDAFFNPDFVKDNGIDLLLLGLATQRAQELDHMVVDDVRNFLFDPPGAGGMDLASLNIQRGRDHGLPSLNDARRHLELAPYTSFLQLAGGDTELAEQLASVYESVDQLDLWIGGLAEQHVDGAMVGETFHKVLADQFTRLRDGDRFFYLNDRVMDELLILAPDFMDASLLSDVIRRNSGVTTIQDNAFIVPGVTSAIPEPVTAGLSLIGLTTLALPGRSRRRRS